MKARLVVGVGVVLTLTTGLFLNLPSQPSFNGSAPSCGGGGCHTLTAGIVTATPTGLNVSVAVSGTTGNVAGELVDSTGTVVAVNDLTSSNPFVLTAPRPGNYVVNAGHKSARVYGIDTVNVNNPLPIRLSMFTGTMVGENAAHLVWETISEVNNYGFTVERRLASEGTFSEVPNSFIAGHGTTTTPYRYEYTDNNAVQGISYYRLAQRDLDGAVHYSEAVRVSTVTAVGEEVPHWYELGQNYPNPFNPSTSIPYHIAAPTDVRLELFDVAGSRVATLVEEYQSPGEYRAKLDGARLSSGVYLYRLTAGGFTATKKLLLTK
jgi:hypothetical protein